MRLLYIPALATPLWLIGCVTGGSIASLPITLSLPTTPQIVDGGGTLTFQVDIVNDFGADGAKWTLTGPGTLTAPATSTAARYVTFYNAPASVVATTSAKVIATSIADTSKATSATITIYPNVVLPASAGSLITKTGAAFSYTMPGSGGSGLLTYAVVSGSLPTGLLLSASGVLSGTATTTGTYSVTVVAQDKLTDGTILGFATQSYTITVS